MAIDADRNNDFDYVVRDNPNISKYEPSDYYCPYTIHTRKTAPRNLEPYIGAKYLESGSIVRGGLPYGPEVRSVSIHGISLHRLNCIIYRRRSLMKNDEPLQMENLKHHAGSCSIATCPAWTQGSFVKRSDTRLTITGR